MSLIEVELDVVEVVNITSWDIFVVGIPFNFYAILTSVMAGIMAMTQWDYGILEY